MVALGISLGLTMPVFNIAVQNAFEQSKIGVVTASTQLFRSIGGTVGIAVLGAVFNNTLAQKSASLADTAYAQSAHASGLNVADPNAVQLLLSSEGQAKVQAALGALPDHLQADALHSFTDFLTQARAVFATTVSHLFLISAIVAVVALIVTLFLKEIPLRQTEAKPGRAKEAGEELAVGLGQAEAKDEPVLTPKQ
jgi:hypothetical protein